MPLDLQMLINISIARLDLQMLQLLQLFVLI